MSFEYFIGGIYKIGSKMNGLRMFTLITFSGILAGCGYAHFAYDEKISGPYRLQAGDNTNDMAVNFTDGTVASERIPSAVFEYGFDENFIVAARHPHIFGETKIDKNKNEYYYIFRSSDGRAVTASQSVQGPFDAAGFEEEKRRLGLPDFRRVLPNLK